RTALEWALGREEAELGLRLAGALWRFWRVRGYLSEGRRWLEGALARCPVAPGAVRANALSGAGMLALSQGDNARARALFEEGRALYQGLGDAQGIAASLYRLGALAFSQGDYAAARALLGESLA